ncbi:RagB/SusD family nutrient uptake outer membrane protein [Sphingobacterium haloxyli]|uniref:RagB/SusD family nutrient uptake outer membrane protein n=1 Tax=Sphingobacterium haloxyli TaxID=2100533 RepID=A0A2S9J8Z3_9SPHI|nr:RagB/SusD family nutrient uptake outer membrane protein [Sphingobacterium haloxyli]PRD49258.1 RagB/SusD family nutrient uptake outer membrane protein [Sphingobacterium haloxyli]
MKIKYIINLLAMGVLGVSCTDLHEDLKSDLTKEQAQEFLDENTDVSTLLERAYRDFDNVFLQHEGSVWLLQEVSADGAIVPSRPSGWDNGGLYRQLHAHRWVPENNYIQSVWRTLNRGVFNSTNVLGFNPPAHIAAEARFLRAYFMFTILDLYNQVPFRNPGDNLLEPPMVFVGKDAVDFIIQEVEAALQDLPDDNPAYRASKNGARGFLARLYLNRGVYADRKNPQFVTADLEKVIEYSEEISGKELDFYWDNFTPNNNEISSELLFTIEGRGGVRSHSLWVWLHAIFPIEMNLPTGGGWNGFAATGDLYDLFEEDDIRRYYEHPLLVSRRYNAGFLIGQQYGPNGEPLNGVIFRKEVPTLVGAGSFDGYRPVKYIPDYGNMNANADNDVVLIRYADVLLMKAEALLRLGREAEALEIVNDIRENRQASTLNSLNLTNLLEERGRELFWEGHRRQDLIRFGKFLEEWHLKPKSALQYLLYPIPPADVLANDNLKQNPAF